jgi:hypothetical protein
LKLDLVLGLAHDGAAADFDAFTGNLQAASSASTSAAWQELPACARSEGPAVRIAGLSELSYPVAMGAMKGITIKLPEATLRQLKQQARQSGRSVAQIVRQLVETPPGRVGSVYAITADLAGSLTGGRQPATNARSRFRR